MVSLIYLIMLWCLWCTIHSVMISLSLTNYLKTRLGDNYRFYRLFFNLIALATLLSLIIYGATLKGPVVLRWDGYLLIFRWVLIVAALLLFISGALKYDLLQLVGIRQIVSGKSHSALSETGNISTSGVLSLTRHPWYLAAIIFIWSGHRNIYVLTLIVNIILTVYIVIGTVLEERKLVIEYGEDYRDYKKRVSMLFPVRWVSFQISNIIHLQSKKS